MLCTLNYEDHITAQECYKETPDDDLLVVEIICSIRSVL